MRVDASDPVENSQPFSQKRDDEPAPPPQLAISVNNAAKVKVIGKIPRDAYELVWMPNHLLALHGWEEPVEILDPKTFLSVRKIAEGKRVVHFAASADGETIAFCENTTRVEIHNVRTGTMLLLDTENHQPKMAFSPDGKLLVTGGRGTQAKLWNTTSGEFIRCLDAPGDGGLTPVFRGDGKLLAVGNGNDVTRLFEVETGKLLHKLPKEKSQELKFSPDGKRLAVAYHHGAYPYGSVALWNVATGNRLVEQKTAAKETHTLDWSPAGDVLATAGLQGTITLWDARTLSVLKELEAPECVIRVRFSPDGSRLFSAGASRLPSGNRKITVWGLDG